MFKRLDQIFNKHKYLKVLYFTNTKQLKIYLVKQDDDVLKVNNKTFLINPNHIFLTKKYKTIIVSSESAETISPLDFKSQYSPEMFNSAINNNLISETFETLNTNQVDWIKVIMFANVAISVVMLYMIMKMNGIL